MKAGGTVYPLTISFDTTPVPLLALVAQGLRIQGSLGSTRSEFHKMLKFVVNHDIRPTIMTWPLNKKGIEDAMTTLREGRMRYRGVLVAE
jgi:D-arabinose 1-dehydrogenase-like Zn-dependent alcohol dehydrogenase